MEARRKDAECKGESKDQGVHGKTADGYPGSCQSFGPDA